MSAPTRTSAQRIAELSDLVTQLQDRPSQLESQMNASPIESNPSSFSASQEKIKVALPDKFDGNCLIHTTKCGKGRINLLFDTGCWEEVFD